MQEISYNRTKKEPFMNPVIHIDTAIKEIDDEVQNIVMNMKLSLTQKDDMMLPLVRYKKVLTQTKEDLEYLIANPPVKEGGCGMAKHRND